MSYTIDFQPVGRRGSCPEGGTLLDAARALGVDLASVCGGYGTCGSCKVQIVAGQVSPVGPREEGELSAAELAQGYRLACLAEPLSDCTVHVPPESLTALQRTQVEGLEVEVEIEPSVVRYAVHMAKPTLKDLRSDDERLLEAAGPDAVLTDLEVARLASTELRQMGWQGHVTQRDREIVHVAPHGAPWLGLAVDIGTTKIAAYIVDLATGQTRVARGAMNPQIAYGEDVVARLVYANKGSDEAAQMQARLTDGLNQVVEEACAEIGAQSTDIVDAVVVGNTAIHHLLLRLPVGQLAAAPYVPAVRGAVDIKARDIGLQLAPGAYVYLLPNIAGYVGADHVAMLLATGLAEREDTVLAIDIGTNTEICLTHQGQMASLSCASGPAFEGAHIKFGMRAAPGAIERVRIADHHIEYKTIGDQPPVGLCGSGILDVVAELRRTKVLDASGRLVGPGIRQIEGEREVVIAGEGEAANGRAITVTQKDIREIQLAKGAIRSGIEALLRDAGITAGDLDQVIIAGAFGTYIDVESANRIGLLPSLPLERVSQVGNAAGMGARLAVISLAHRLQAQAVAQRVRYIELARSPQFARNYAEAMRFPNA
jgi:uncharacterized 2Fe-2S/4Fe-4S cluster protein (DUF4445 family)